MAEMGSSNISTGAILFSQNPDYRKLADLAFVSHNEVRNLGYKTVSGRTHSAICEIHETSIPRSGIRWTKGKLCPHCLKESSHIRKIWDLTIVTVCPLHRCLLIDSCPKCRRDISALRFKVDECSCGFDFKTHSPLTIEEDELSITRRVWQACGLKLENSCKVLLAPLSDMGLRELHQTIEIIHKLITGSSFRDSKQAFFVKSPNLEVHNSLLRCNEVLMRWPTAFDSLIDNRPSLKMTQHQGDSESSRNKLIEALIRVVTLKNKAGKPRRTVGVLCTALANYACQNKGWIRPTSRLTDYVSTQNVFLTLNVAEKLLNVNHEAMLGLIKSNIVRTRAFCTGKTTRLLVNPLSLQEFKSKYEQSLTSYNAAKLLGISRQQVNRFVTCKVLIPLCGPGVCDHMDWRFDQTDVHSLIQNVLAHAPVNKVEGNNGWLSIQQAVCVSHYINVPTPKLFQLIIEGKLGAIRIPGLQGLAGLRVSKPDLVSFCLEKSEEVSPDHWTINRVAKTLGVKQATIRHFIRSGFLRARQMPWKNKYGVEGKLTYNCITSEDLAAFNDKFILPREIANQYSLTLRITSSLLKLSGLVPLCSPKPNVSGLYIFYRADVNAIGNSFISSPSAKFRLRRTRRYYKKTVKSSWN